MNEMVLPGCRNDSLLGYLKALGLLRVFSTQADQAVRASWRDATLVLHTAQSNSDVATFLLEAYAPTPVVNPWNNGAGFDGKADAATQIIDTIRKTKSPRWAAYRSIVELITERYVKTGRRQAFIAEKKKEEFLRDLRQHYPEEGLAWLDVAVVIAADRVVYPYLLGSGGNDGRLDFAVNFAARALEVIGDEPLKESSSLLADALYETSTAQLKQSAIGQFSPRYASGPNATSGFDAESLVNPWDFVLMIEGAMMFSGALVKRIESDGNSSDGRSRSTQFAFPFAFRSAGGYGASSTEEGTRGEVWLPIWNGRASLQALRDLFRKARADIVPGNGSQVRAAASASEAAVAALTAGISTGVGRLQRVAFVQRNGLAYAATVAGTVSAPEHGDELTALITGSIAHWVEGMRKGDAAKGGAVAEALRQFDTLLFEYAAAPEERNKHAGQELLAGLAALDVALSRKQPGWPPPLRYLNAAAINTLDDGSWEHNVAAALASLGGSDRAKRLRLQLEHVKADESGLRLVYDRTIQPATLSAPTLAKSLAQIAAVRARRAAEPKGRVWWTAARGAAVKDVAAMLQFDRDNKRHQRCWDRLANLILAYAIVEPSARFAGTDGDDDEPAQPAIPGPYAVMKLILDHPRARDERILALLAAGHPERALDLAARRARTIGGLRGRWRDVDGAIISDPQWYAAALLVPIARGWKEYRRLLCAAMTHKGEEHVYEDYKQLVNSGDAKE
ncbi:type I-U CRISPR-associated protein Csx17 [bacterium]|nr:MAG: type I-U CRISPR-associated protein Csx17 [bacterium]